MCIFFNLKSKLRFFNFNFDVGNLNFWSSTVNFILQLDLTFKLLDQKLKLKLQFWCLVSIIWTINWIPCTFSLMFNFDLFDLCWIGSQLLFPLSPYFLSFFSLFFSFFFFSFFCFSQILLAFLKSILPNSLFLLGKAKRIWLKSKRRRKKEVSRKEKGRQKEYRSRSWRAIQQETDNI